MTAIVSSGDRATATEPPLTAPTKNKSSTRRVGLAGAGFALPFMLLFLFCIVAPLVYAINLSFFNDKLVGTPSFVGLRNYWDALKDPSFQDSIVRMIEYLCIQVPIMIILAIVAALILDSGRVRLSGAYRLLMFLPFAVPGVVASLMWGYLYGPKFGLIHQSADKVGLGTPDLLSSQWILGSITNIQVWAFMGYNMLILYSALKLIPTDQYEAAAIDGASSLRVALSIKLPSMRPSIFVTVLFSIIGAFQLFNEPQVLQPLANAGAIPFDYTPNMYAYNTAFTSLRYDYAAALAVLMGLITIIFAGLAALINRGRRQPK